MLRLWKFGPTALLAALALLLLAGCTASPLKPDVDFNEKFDFSKTYTISFYEGSGEVSGDNPLQISDIQRDRINEALISALKAKGLNFVEDPGQADLLLSWHLGTQFKTDVRTYNSAGYGAVGYGRYGGYNRYSMYNCWSCMGGGSEISVRDYTEGTFIVDMIDPAEKVSVWRGIVQSKLKGEQARDQESYNAAAATILASFPPHSSELPAGAGEPAQTEI